MPLPVLPENDPKASSLSPGSPFSAARSILHLSVLTPSFSSSAIKDPIFPAFVSPVSNHESLWSWKGAQLRKHIDATLGSGNLREAVRLPPGEDINEWLAVNTVDFFNQVNLLYGTLTEFCTPDNCPTMTAGPKYEYRWADGVQIKKPIEVSAPKYVEYLMDWIEGQLDDESIFPQRLGAPFPANFKEVVKTIFKRLFRVYAHIYHTHFQKIEFGLIDKKELAPLQELIESIIVPY
nr:MOB kinase activator-like 1B isoform X1 [Ipomoea trifida]